MNLWGVLFVLYIHTQGFAAKQADCLEISTSLCEKMSVHLLEALNQYKKCMEHRELRFSSFNDGDCPPPCMVKYISMKCVVRVTSMKTSPIALLTWPTFEDVINTTVDNGGNCPMPFVLNKRDDIIGEMKNWLQIFCTCIDCKLRKLFEEGGCLSVDKLRRIIEECFDETQNICPQTVITQRLFVEAYLRFLTSHVNFDCCFDKPCSDTPVGPTTTPATTVSPTITPATTVAPTTTPAPTMAPTTTPATTVAPTTTPATTVAPTTTPATTVVTTVITTPEETCPDGFGLKLDYGAKSSCYKFALDQERTKDEARQYCTSRGADLVAIETEYEMNHLTSIIRNSINFLYNQYWSSGTDEGTEGVWRWASSGAPINGALPDRYFVTDGNTQNCLYIFWDDTNSEWHDGGCIWSRLTLCEAALG